MNQSLWAAFLALALLAQSTPAAAAEQTRICGRINAFTEPTASAPGSVTIGTRTVAMATSVAFYPRSGVAPPNLGGIGCVTGELGSSGAFITVTAAGHPFMAPYPQCGTVQSFRAATATTAGRIELGGGANESQQTLRIPPGRQLPADSASGHRCFNQELNAQGDLQVTERNLAEESGYGTRPGSGALPFTSTAPFPMEGSGVTAILSFALLAVLLSWHAYTRRSRGPR